MTVFATCSRGCAFEVAVLSETERLRVEAAHNRRYHGETTTLPVVQLDHVSWQQAFLAALAAIPVGEELTTADLHALVPPPHHSNAWGGATSAAAHLGLIREVATQKSELATTKRSLVRRWVRCEAGVKTA